MLLKNSPCLNHNIFSLSAVDVASLVEHADIRTILNFPVQGFLQSPHETRLKLEMNYHTLCAVEICCSDCTCR